MLRGAVCLGAQIDASMRLKWPIVCINFQKLAEPCDAAFCKAAFSCGHQVDDDLVNQQVMKSLLASSPYDLKAELCLFWCSLLEYYCLAWTHATFFLLLFCGGRGGTVICA